MRLAAGRAPLQASQRAAWSELAGRVADTRRASPDAVRTWRGDGHGAREKKARRAEAGRAGAARGWAGPRRGARGAGGSLGRLRLAGQKRGGGPLKQKTFFSISIFNKFSNNSFQILF